MKPRLRQAMPMRMPIKKPMRPTSAFKSPPPRRSTIRSGQPRKASAPMTTNPPMTKRSAGDEPARALNSLPATLMRNAPSTRPMISGRTYCTLAALCRPQAPAVSRRKQAMQKPILAGLPIAVRMRAARPTATPARTTPQWIFFIFSPLLVLSLSLFFEKDIDEHSIKSPSKNGKWIYPKKTVISSVFPMILPSCFL